MKTARQPSTGRVIEPTPGVGRSFDVMGNPNVPEVYTNSITKLQYGWLHPKNVKYVNKSISNIELFPIDSEEAILDLQMIIIPIPQTNKAYVLELKKHAKFKLDSYFSGVYVYVIDNIEKFSTNHSTSLANHQF